MKADNKDPNAVWDKYRARHRNGTKSWAKSRHSDPQPVHSDLIGLFAYDELTVSVTNIEQTRAIMIHGFGVIEQNVNLVMDPGRETKNIPPQTDPRPACFRFTARTFALCCIRRRVYPSWCATPGDAPPAATWRSRRYLRRNKNVRRAAEDDLPHARRVERQVFQKVAGLLRRGMGVSPQTASISVRACSARSRGHDRGVSFFIRLEIAPGGAAILRMALDLYISELPNQRA